MLNVTPIPAFSDNYIWCITRSHTPSHGSDGGDGGDGGDSDAGNDGVSGKHAVVVDPGDAGPVLQHLSAKELTLAGIIITHHHFDHTGGIDDLLAERQVPVWGPRNPAISQITDRLGEGDNVEILGVDWRIIEVPGHTLDHIAYYTATTSPPTLLCGDTLFAGGCGRVFEGNPAMMLSSLNKLAALPAETRLYCAHEYTMANLAFAEAVEPDNRVLQERKQRDATRRERDEPTVPSQLGTELATNPFLRCTQPDVANHMAHRDGVDPADPVSVFAAVRGWKDQF